MDDNAQRISDPMKPEILYVNDKPCIITYCDRVIDVDPSGRSLNDGQYDPWDRTIRIYDGGRSFEEIWHTMFHEIIHVIEVDLKRNFDEDTVDLLALGINGVFFRNRLFSIGHSAFIPGLRSEPKEFEI